MTLQDIADLISSWEYPFAYFEFDVEGSAPEPPYVVYFLDESNDFFADNINYQKNRTLYVEVYCSSKKQAMSVESTIEASLIENEIPFSKDNDYISDERLYVTIYTTEVCLNG